MVAHDFLDVRLFHKKFFLPTDMPMPDGHGVAPPKLIDGDLLLFRINFLREELAEFSMANAEANIVKVADALIDFVYVVYGTALCMGATPNPLPGLKWPTFDFVAEELERWGMRTPGAPQLLDDALLTVCGDRMAAELHMFSMSHRDSIGVASVPMSICHLWAMAYHAYITAVFMRLPWQEGWKLVQEANMAKVRAQMDGSDSTRGSRWDVIKPKGWRAPDAELARLLFTYGANVPAPVMAEAVKASEPRT